MSNTQPIVTTLSSKNLYYSFLAGAHKIFEKQDYLNKINVYPVPDADTGTNLASTMHSIVNSHIPLDNVKQTATALADAAITGARGNSGIIFAQFLYGFGNEIDESNDMDISHFSMSLQKAVGYAYGAINNPVEGTMITVMREWAEFIEKIKYKTDNFIQLLTESYQRALQSLKETPQKLEVLKKNKVVDAGAQGFVVFLEGMLEFFKYRKVINLIKTIKAIPVAETLFEDHSNISFRYCTEALISGEKLNSEIVRKNISYLGDSLVVAGSERKVRIHIHTDQPAHLFKELSAYGTIDFQKVDDMILQRETAQNRINKTGLVTDSTCDLPQELLDKYQIHTVPLNLHIGKNQYLDKVAISAEHFYDILDKHADLPTTSQPGIKEFENKFAYLLSHYDSLISWNLSKVLSGTWSNATNAALKASETFGKKVSVLNSRHISASLGLLVLRTARSLQKGMTHEDVESRAEEWIGKTKIYVCPKTLKYFIKGGRVSPLKGFIANLLNLKPIISVDEEGNSTMLDRSFGRSGSVKKVLGFIRKHMNDKKIWEYAVVYSNKEERKHAEAFAVQIEEIVHKKPAYISTISPVVGRSAGLGTIAVALMFE